LPETTPRTLSHFTLLHFTEPYYQLNSTERQHLGRQFLEGLRDCAPVSHLYQVYPAQAGVDLLLWCSLPTEQPADAARFFERLACATLPHRQLIEPVQILWGFTRPSQYTRSRSAQEIDPFEPERKPYLVLYPFVKTTEWYQLSQETRQGMMNGHIKIGKQFPEIRQLLLYSFGLQDQEFIVVYEMDDLLLFSDLVSALRSTEARRYTLRDTPLTTALYHPPAETLGLWA
jgi:chlorite dismutase